MSAPRGGSGAWNRTGRRSGGAKPAVIRADSQAHAREGMFGPFCVMDRHELCAGDCICPCHAKQKGRP